MPRRATGRLRGHRADPHAKRKQTTRIGRRTGRDPVDHGSELLRTKKRLVAAGREDLPIDGASALYGRGYLDREQFDILGTLSSLLQRVARAWGGHDGSVSGFPLSEGSAIVIPSANCNGPRI